MFLPLTQGRNHSDEYVLPDQTESSVRKIRITKLHPFTADLIFRIFDTHIGFNVKMDKTMFMTSLNG
jgi:hypothetical protein